MSIARTLVVVVAAVVVFFWQIIGVALGCRMHELRGAGKDDQIWGWTKFMTLVWLGMSMIVIVLMAWPYFRSILHI